jgi:4-hydroxyphenylpyruvate dioxygenase
MMKIDHIHFFLEDAVAQADQFIEKIGCQRLFSAASTHTHTEVLKNGSIYFVLSSPLTSLSPAFQYLKHHSEGVVDVALSVENLTSVLIKASTVSEAPQSFSCQSGHLKWAKVAGWDALSHTIIENTSGLSFCEAMGSQIVPDYEAENVTQTITQPRLPETDLSLTQIDHVVLNVPSGLLEKAVDWYRNLFALQVQQTFKIQTQHSGLNSQVLSSPGSELYFNINEPTSANSQIQKFLEANRGSGIQHIALQTKNIIQVVAQMKRKGQKFLSVPPAYYAQLKQKLMSAVKPLLNPVELAEIQSLGILADIPNAEPTSALLQIFTQPIFNRPTFFFEIIERRHQALGFGEGNFQALFVAIETEQSYGERSASILE